MNVYSRPTPDAQPSAYNVNGYQNDLNLNANQDKETSRERREISRFHPNAALIELEKVCF